MKWEYTDKDLGKMDADDRIETLNRMGRLEWELCGVFNNCLFFFKREAR